jgi:outer membrane receptor protein involved in Fe transport
MVITPRGYQPRRCWLALLCLLSLGAHADEFAYLELSLEQLLETPVTGSTLTEESIKTVPAAVSVFTHEHIERLGVDYLHELLGLVPGFQFNRNANSGLAYSYSARGRRTTHVSLEVLLLVDGKVFNDPRGGSPDVTMPLFPLVQVERVEVIRGPGSAVYGSSAFTGVINIVTRKQQKSVAVGVGSEARRALDVLWSHAGESWQADAYVHAYEDRGQALTITDSFNHLPLDSDDPRRLLNVDLGLRRGKTQIDLTYYRGESEDFYLSENTANGVNDHARELWNLSVDQGFEWTPDIKSNLSVSYQQFTFALEGFVQGPGALAAVSVPSSNEPFRIQATQAGESYRLAYTTDWSIDELSSAQWGIQAAHHEEIKARAYTNYNLLQLIQQQFPITYYGDMSERTPLGISGSQSTTGIHGQYIRSLRDSTRLTIGGRYDDYSDVDARFSPRLALVEQLNEIYSLKLLYGEAFRAPTLAETAFINNPTLLGNPDLKHEIVKTWDLIVMGNWQKTSLSAGLFQSHYEHPIMTGFIGNRRTYVNGESERSEGLELEWLQKLSDHWSLRSTYTHMNLPMTAFREAESLASFEINYAAQRWNWNLSGVYQDEHQAPVSATTQVTLDDFWLLNTQWRYRFEGGYDISLQIKNLTDENYATPAQGLGKLDGVPGRGRELTAEIQWRW